MSSWHGFSSAEALRTKAVMLRRLGGNVTLVGQGQYILAARNGQFSRTDGAGLTRGASCTAPHPAKPAGHRTSPTL